jgi:maleylacetoacetate isomerase
MKSFRRLRADVPRQLYTFFRSSTSFRLRIALAHKGLDYEPRYISLPKMEHRDASYRALNPQGLVPLLVDGDHAHIQSLAIIEYLDEAYPEPPLIPKDIHARAYVRAVSQIIACEMHPLNNVRVLKHLNAQFGADEATTKVWYAHWITEGFRGLEDYLSAEKRHGRFCLGDSVTMADICLVPQVFNAARFDCPVDGYPIIKAIFDRCMTLDAFAKAQPNTQKDAF